MLIKLDNREGKLIDEFKNKNINVNIAQLSVGDIIIEDNNEEPLIIFERKSLNDLASSIMDGRYSEQSFRLNENSLHNHNIIYLIEGDLETYKAKIKRITKDVIENTIVSLQYFKGFTVIKSKDIEETCKIITTFFNKIKKENKPGFYKNSTLDNVDNTTKDYCSVIKSKVNKKDHITVDNIHCIMLQQIPDINYKTASAILNNYKNIFNLVKALEEDNNVLDNFKMESNGKERKISKKCIENIKKFLLNE